MGKEIYVGFLLLLLTFLYLSHLNKEADEAGLQRNIEASEVIGFKGARISPKI